MAEPDKQQIGEGSDSYGSAARNAGKAIRQAGQNAAKESAQKGAEAAVLRHGEGLRHPAGDAFVEEVQTGALERGPDRLEG